MADGVDCGAGAPTTVKAETCALEAMGQALKMLQTDVSQERPSREKSLAITNLEQAIMWLQNAPT